MLNWNNRLFRIGVVGSAAWLIISIAIIALAGNWDQRLRPNEWADIFAGLAAPMAFLWLVLGFLQQGQELKLQIEELRNTVKHQADLAQSSREQLAAQLRQAVAGERARQAAVRPRIILSFGGSSSGGGVAGVEYTTIVRNVGAAATSVKVEIPSGTQVASFPAIGQDEEKRFAARHPQMFSSDMSAIVRFTDADGIAGETKFIAKPVSGNSLSFEPS